MERRNKRIVITGGSSGIGKQLALQYTLKNYDIIIASNIEQDLIQTKKECEQLNKSIKVYTFLLDVTDQQQCKQLFQFVDEKFKGIDILMLCAGILAHFKFQSVVDKEDVQMCKKIMDINYYGYFYCTLYAWKLLQKVKGQIIVVSSFSGEMGLPFRTVYCASKFAVNGFFEALQREQQEISITIVSPPSVNSDFRKNALMMEGGDGHKHEYRISVKDAALSIIKAGELKTQRLIFPRKAFLATVLKNVFPNYITKKVNRFAKL